MSIARNDSLCTTTIYQNGDAFQVNLSCSRLQSLCERARKAKGRKSVAANGALTVVFKEGAV